MRITFSEDDVVTAQADSRGRVTLGADHAQSGVWFTILDVSTTDLADMDASPVDVAPENVIERRADSRGRIRLGPEYAEKHVRVAVLRVAESA